MSSNSLAAVPGPIALRDRIQIIDVLRGFALLGVVLQNIVDGAWSKVPHTLPLDRFSDAAMELFASGKFMSVFTFLFGLGFSIQMERASRTGVPFTTHYLWRMALLALIGIAHNLLIWGRQDILLKYAIFGALLLLFRHAAPRTLLLAVLLCYLAHPFRDSIANGLRGVTGPGDRPLVTREERTACSKDPACWEEMNRLRAAYATEHYAEIVRRRVAAFGTWHASIYNVAGNYIVRELSSFALFLLGLYAGRVGFLDGADNKRPLYWRVFWLSLAIAVSGQSALSFLPEGVWRTYTDAIATPALSAFYVSAICLLPVGDVRRALFTPFSWVGRLCLTNYIGASFLVATIYLGYGFGLYRQIGLTAAIALQFVLFAVQVGLSGLWLRRFQIGPVEWLWRSATWRRWQPIRVER